MLYYIDRSYEKEISVFEPRIPNATMDGEENVTPRICLCNTIQGCINAAPWGHSKIQYRKLEEVFRLYCFNENDINPKNIISSDELWEKGLVPDAYITGEVWIVHQNVKPSEIKYFKIGEYFDSEYVPILTKKEYLQEIIGENIDYSNIYTWEIINEIEIIELNKSELIFTDIIKIPIKYINQNYSFIQEYASIENDCVEEFSDKKYCYYKFEYIQAFNYNEMLKNLKGFISSNFLIS